MTANPGDIVGFDRQDEAVTLQPAADSSAKSRIPIWAKHVTVTANTNGTTDWLVLPTGVTAGHTITGYAGVAHKLRTETSSTIKINNVNSDGTAAAQLVATNNWRATYMGTTGWVLLVYTNLGAAGTTVVPA